MSKKPTYAEVQKRLAELEARQQQINAQGEGEEQYRIFFELGAVGMAQADPATGRLLAANDRMCELTGYSREELLASTVRDLTHPDDREADWRKFTAMIRGETPEYSNEKRYLHKDGKVIWVHVAARVVRDPAGRPIRTVAILQDITERKQMEQALRKAKEALEEQVRQRTVELEDTVGTLRDEVVARTLAEKTLQERSRMLDAFFRHAVTPLVILDSSFNFIRVNEAYAKACQKDVFDFPGHNHFEFYPHAENQAIFENVARTRKPYQAFAKPFSFPDHPEWGVTYWDWTLTPLLDDAGEVEYLVFALEDVTGRTVAEQKARVTSTLLELFAKKTARKEYLDAVVEVIQAWSGCRCLGVRVVDQDQRIPYESYTGFSREFWELENWLFLKTDVCACVRVVLGTPEGQDRPAMTPAGSFYLNDSLAFLHSMTPAQQARFRGNCIRSGFSTIAVLPLRYHDQTLGAIHLADERKDMLPPAGVEFLESMAPLIAESIHRFNAEAELARYREHLEELVRQRTSELEHTAAELKRSNEDLQQFAYVASHDLQEPLRVVSGFLKLLDERYKPQLDDTAREYISFAVEGAVRMSRLVRDLLEYSRMERKEGKKLRPTDVAKALVVAMANLHGSIQEAGATVSHGDLPTVLADPTQMAQLFQNLIGNAIKFRNRQRPCQVHVGAKREAGNWVFSVRDNGIGIPKEHFDRIFVIFQRLHRQEEYSGTGIGLAVCKRIVEHHGGRIWVESTPGEGSTFRFTIPSATGGAAGAA